MTRAVTIGTSITLNFVPKIDIKDVYSGYELTDRCSEAGYGFGWPFLGQKTLVPHLFGSPAAGSSMRTCRLSVAVPKGLADQQGRCLCIRNGSAGTLFLDAATGDLLGEHPGPGVPVAVTPDLAVLLSSDQPGPCVLEILRMQPLEPIWQGALPPEAPSEAWVQGDLELDVAIEAGNVVIYWQLNQPHRGSAPSPHVSDRHASGRMNINLVSGACAQSSMTPEQTLFAAPQPFSPPTEAAHAIPTLDGNNAMVLPSSPIERDLKIYRTQQPLIVLSVTNRVCSVAVVGDKVFLEQQTPENQSLLACYHQKDASLLWTLTLPGNDMPPPCMPPMPM